MSILFFLLSLFFFVSIFVAFINPAPFNKLPVKEMSRRRWAGTLFAMCLVSFILFAATIEEPTPSTEEARQNQTQTEARTESVEETETVPEVKPVEYEIVETEDLSRKAMGDRSLSEYTLEELERLPINKKINYKIVVPTSIKNNQVEPTVDKIISDITEEDNDIDELIVSLYSDKELIDSQWDVARAIWAVDGDLGNVDANIASSNDRSRYGTSLDIKENLEEYLSQRGKTEKKHGLTEAERKQLYKEVVAAEDRARDEADELFPIDSRDPGYHEDNIMKNNDKYNELADKYRAAVFEKYNITKEIFMNSISSEAYSENWPLE